MLLGGVCSLLQQYSRRVVWRRGYCIRWSSIISSISTTPSVTLSFNDDSSLAVLTLCNPRRRNALTFSMMHQLDAHVNILNGWSHDVSGENNARVLLLTGSDGTFCSGLDINQNDSGNNDKLKDGKEMTKHMSRVTNLIHSLPVLSVAAIDGNAIGGGAELSTCTDLVVLSRSATVKFVHASRGASPGWGGGRRLVKKVGRCKALRMQLLGEPVSGDEEAKQLDYADFVADDGESSYDAAMRLVVDPVLSLPCSKSIRAIKSVVSVADGDDDVIDVSSGHLKHNSTAVKSEIDSFVHIWGGKSNIELIEQARESLREKKNTS